MGKFAKDYLVPELKGIDYRIGRLGDEIRHEFEKEQEDLSKRVIKAETKLKLYEALFSKLNLNMELKDETTK